MEPSLVVHACNAGSKGAEAGGSLRAGGKPQPQSEFKADLSTTVRPELKTHQTHMQITTYQGNPGAGEMSSEEALAAHEDVSLESPDPGIKLEW